MISIIIPTYNAEVYVQRCIESVLSQAYKDFEIIVVNDGSKDSTAEILDKLSAQDSRVRVFHNENHGVSFSRNFGLSQALGEYIMFLDADDKLGEDALSVISENLYNPSKCGLLNFNHYDEYDDHNVERGNCKMFIHTRNNDEVNDALAQITPNFVWDKVFSRKVINDLGLNFDENMSYGEDTIFLCQYLEHVDEVVIIPRCIHYYHRDVQQKSLSQQYVKGIEQIVRRLFIEQEKLVCLYPDFEKSLATDSYRGGVLWRSILGLYNLQAGNTSKERIEVMTDFNARGWFKYLANEYEQNSMLGKTLLLLLKTNNMQLVDFAMHSWFVLKSIRA